MPIHVNVENGFLLAIGIIISLQIIVVAVSALNTRFRRHRHNTLLGRFHLDPLTIGNNEVQLFTYGNDLYAYMLEDIRHATRRICLESFIWKGDKIGNEMKNALIEKANEGIEVYVIFDAFANLVVRRSFKRFPENIHVCRYHAWRHLIDIIDPRRLARDHRKLLIVDESIGYVGGYNIGDLYGKKWRDTHVRILGDAATNLYQSFITIWNDNTKKDLALGSTVTALQPNIRVYANNPSRITFPIRSMYIDAIDLAKEQIYLTTPYFIPDRYVLHALIKAAKRGVNVQLMVPEQSNHLLADWLARTYFTDCLQQGIRIWLYQGAMIHAKTATIDGKWTTIGTANLDRMSLMGNYEMNLEFFHEELAEQMKVVFAQDSKACRELELHEWVHRPLVQKLGELILSPLWPFL